MAKPSSFVVMRTAELLSAKCTSAPCGKASSGSTALLPATHGGRSFLYWSTASSTAWV